MVTVQQTVNTDGHNPNECTPLLQSDSLSQNTDIDPNNNTDMDNNLSILTDVPAIETNQSLVVSVDLNPDTTAAADTENEHSNDNASNNPSSIPVEALHNPVIEVKSVDAEQKYANEEVTLTVATQTNEYTHSDQEESKPVEQ